MTSQKSFKITGYDDIPEETPIKAIEPLVSRVQRGFKSFKTIPLAYRRDQLRNLYYALYDNQEILYKTLYQDLHKSPQEVDMTETFWVLNEVQWYLKNLEQLAAPESVSGLPLSLRAASAKIHKQPFGSVLIITPWNYPVFLAISPIAAAIAAGNSVIFKPSELSSHTSRALIKILSNALDPETFVGITGSIPQSTELLRLKYDKIIYTGNGVVGRIVSQAAAKHLTPVILELGGKSPVIITKTANLRNAARRVLWGKQINAGQTCVAPDYVLIEESVRQEFIKELKATYNEFNKDLLSSSSKNDDSSSSSSSVTNSDVENYPHIINDRHFARLKSYFDNTNGKVILGGQLDESTKFFPPTIVDGVNGKDSLLKEEIFGPLLGLVSFKGVKEAAEFVITEHDTPLALYIFSNDKTEQQYLLDHIRSGGVAINDTLLHLTIPQAPFGGVGESGSGSYHGKFGFDAFSHSRTVLNQPNFVESLLAVRYPPFTPAKQNRHKFINGPSANPGFPRSGPVAPGGGNSNLLSYVLRYVFSKFSFWVILLVGVLASRYSNK